MNKLDNTNLITLDELYQLLSKRIDIDEKKLKDIPPPNLLKNAKYAAKRVATAIKNKEKITIIGDYDVDGVTSSSIMVLFFREINYPIQCIIPNRFTDGYGINTEVLKRVDADIIITVDNGISAILAAQLCKQRGIDLIITDHHTPPNILPDAYAIINPKIDGCLYPFKEICGAQVAWLFLGLIKQELSLHVDLKQYLGLVAIAIIADIMPLKDINRTIVKAGLNHIIHSTRPCFVIIKEFLNKDKLLCDDIGFMIAPRLNAAGRLQDASIALDFLTSCTHADAVKQFELLNNLNEQRKGLQLEAVQMASLHVNKNDKIIVIAKENWNEGVVGIVASQLADKYQKPAIVLSINEDIAKGSARSIGEVDIFSIINSAKELLIKFGGHKMAAGLSLHVDKLDRFRKIVNQTASKLKPSDFIIKHEIVGQLNINSINFELLNLLDKFEPFGEANPRPKFLIKNAQIIHIKYFGVDKSHSKLSIKLKPYDKKLVEVIAFRQIIAMPKNKKITCSFTVNKNIFNKNISIQLIMDKHLITA